MKNIFRIYLVSLGLAVLLLVFIGLTFERNVTTESGRMPADRVGGCQISEEDNRIRIKYALPEVDGEDVAVAFYTVHQNVRVRIGDAVVYELQSGGNSFGRTPGHGWNFVTVRPADVGEELEITLEAAYRGVGRPPELYMGSRTELLRMILEEDAPGIAVCAMTMIAGLLLLVYSAVVWIKTRIGSELFYLGIFAVLMGIWSMNEISFLPLFFRHDMLSAYLAYISLDLMLIPFILFVRSMFSDQEHILWKLCCGLSLANFLGTTLLQLLNVRDYREMLWGMHLSCVLFLLALVYLTVQEIRRKTFTKEMVVKIVSLFVVVCGFLLDLGTYYAGSRDSNVFGRVCFLIYIVILGCLSAQRVGSLADKGKEMELYHSLAFTDALTGVYNRTAYSKHMENYYSGTLESVQAFMLDLNNLKWCNDNLGHTMGDYYIIHASELIRQSFGKEAGIYRIGGDEFCVLTKGMTIGEINAVLQTFETKKIIVRLHELCFTGRIACGYSGYEMGDEDAYAIMRRADARMYENKKKLKEMDRWKE